MNTHSREWPVAPGLILGAALAGFFDGVVFHQILQWHHMICVEAHCNATSLASLTRMNLTDGLFHAAMLATLVVGLAWLTQALAQGRRFSAQRFWGAIVLGAGVFNVSEGILDHHILGIHHVRFGAGQPVWDLGFLAAGALIAAAGTWMLRDPNPGSDVSGTSIH